MTIFLVAASIFAHIIVVAFSHKEEKLGKAYDLLFVPCFFGVIWTWVWVAAAVWEWMA